MRKGKHRNVGRQATKVPRVLPSHVMPNPQNVSERAVGLYSTETRKEDEQADHVYAPRLRFVTECRHDQRRLSQLAHPLTIRRLSMSMTLAPLIILTNFINKIRKDTSPLCSHSSKDAHEHFLESLITPQKLEHDMKRVRSSDIPKTTQKISIADI